MAKLKPFAAREKIQKILTLMPILGNLVRIFSLKPHPMDPEPY
jgi:hypothetical protein